MQIACIGSHPDDIELAMGGTASLLVALGHKVYFIDLSNGEPTPCGDAETRKIESEKAASTIGVSRITLDNPNRYIFDSILSRKKLATLFREIRPEIIFTHYEFDFHPDHIATTSITEAGRFYSKLSKSDIEGEPFFPGKIIYYFPNHIHLNILPSFLVDITDTMEIKKNAIKCYESQFIKRGGGVMIENCIKTNSYYGIRIGKNYAEPFYLRDSLDILYFAQLFSNHV